MTSAYDELDAACFELARATKWVRKPVDADQIRALAERFSSIACSFVSGDLEIDQPLITRAVRYLTQVHAIPPMDDDTQWFANMLVVVLEIARPNTTVDEPNRGFLKDMRDGIDSLLSAR